MILAYSKNRSSKIVVEHSLHVVTEHTFESRPRRALGRAGSVVMISINLVPRVLSYPFLRSKRGSLFVISQILGDTWPDPTRVSPQVRERTWERGCISLSIRRCLHSEVYPPGFSLPGFSTHRSRRRQKEALLAGCQRIVKKKTINPILKQSKCTRAEFLVWCELEFVNVK